MLKVLQINKMFYPWIGGVETVVKQLADGFVEKPEFIVDVLAANEIKSKKKVISKDFGYTVYKTPGIGIKFSTPLSFNYLVTFKKLIKQYDIFHFHVPNPLGELAHFLYSIPKHKKVVVTFHADVAKTRWSFFYLPYSILLHKLLKRADVIISTAPNNLENLKILSSYKNKCSVIPLAYDSFYKKEINESDKIRFCEKIGWTNKNKLLFVGRLGYYKGINVLLKAIEALDVQLLIVGEGKLKNELIEQVEKAGIKHKVIFGGFLSEDDLAVAYSSAKIFVLPSVSEAEAFGLVQLEAMNFGVPVINTNLPTGVPFVSLNEVTGITVTPSSDSELKNAIKTLLDNEQLLKKYSENSKLRARQFTTDSMIEAYKKVYMS